MTKRIALLIAFVALIELAEAQPANKAKVGELVFREGYTLGVGRQIFRQQLRDLGYIEGKNIVFETRSAKGNIDQFPILAAELVRVKVDLLVASSTNEARVFKKATTEIPIVFHITTDPVADGLVDSLARPNGNITGVTTITAVLAGKRLELLKETVPNSNELQFYGIPEATAPYNIARRAK